MDPMSAQGLFVNTAKDRKASCLIAQPKTSVSPRIKGCFLWCNVLTEDCLETPSLGCRSSCTFIVMKLNLISFASTHA